MTFYSLSTAERAVSKEQQTGRIARVTAEPAKRAAKVKANERASQKKHATSYGGSKWVQFKREITARDGGLCQLCQKVSCKPVDVAHLRQKVQMGGRKKVSINFPHNAALLGRICHAKQEEDGRLTEQIERRLAALHGYTGYPWQEGQAS